MVRRADEDFGRFERAFRTVAPSYKGNIRSKFKRFKLKRNPELAPQVMAVSENPSVRCLDCGWKYNVQLTDQCPVCLSDRSRLLANEDPFSNPVAIFAYPLLGFAFWAVFLFSVRHK